MTNGNNEVERQFNRVVDALGALFSGKRLVRDDIPHTEACDRFSLEFSRQRFAEVNVAMHDLGVAIRQTHAHEPKACETFPGEVHPLGKLTNLICDVIEHARDSSPHSNEFEALVQTMWDEYNAKLLAQGASRELSASESASFHKTLARSPRVVGPASLVGALQDVVHTDPGPVRAGKAVRDASSCEHDLQKKNHTMILTHDLRTGHEYDSVAKCKVCGEQFIHPLHSSQRT